MSLRTRVVARRRGRRSSVAVVLLALAVPALLASQLGGALDRSLQSRAVDVARLAAATPEPADRARRARGPARRRRAVRAGRRPPRADRGPLERPRRRACCPQATAAAGALRARRAAYADAQLGTEPIRLYAAPLGELGSGDAAGRRGAGGRHHRGHRRHASRAPAAPCCSRRSARRCWRPRWPRALAGRALRPLRRLSSGARGIERSGDASGRLPAPVAHDEVGELADTLNAMLASLERAREAERRFVGDASHELRTPLTALRGNAAYVARHGADPAALADLEADAARLSGLLDDLLALAREDAAAPVRGEPVDLAELAREAAAADERAEAQGGPASCSASAPRSSGRSATSSATPASTARPAAASASRSRRTAGTRGCSSPTRAPGSSAEEAAHAFERFWRGPGARGEGSGPRPGHRARDRRAPRRPRRGRGRVLHARAARALKDLSRIARTTHASPSRP